MPTIIDTHCHIYYDEFKTDWEEMLNRADSSGIKGMVVVGTDLESSIQAASISEKYPYIYFTAGIHPHDAKGADEEDLNKIVTLVKNRKTCVAIGEIGLDFYRNNSPHEDQERIFKRLLEIAKELNKPVVIHDRDAHSKTLVMIKEAGIRNGVMHCFSGDLDFAIKCIEQGLHISIPGTVTYPSNKQLREVVQNIPLERMLLETDSPYLSPVPYRGKRNEPAHTLITAEKVAELRNITVDELGWITTMNAGRLFRIPSWDSSTKIAYRIRNSLYLNITNQCSNSCIFCPKFKDFNFNGNDLLLEHEPGFDEVMAAINNPEGIEEIVFCGYGEPLIRLDLVKQLSFELKNRGYRIRINTDGQANLVHGRNILPELAGLVDSISISLNAQDAQTYIRICKSPFADYAFTAISDFIREATRHINDVTATVVNLPDVDTAECRRIAQALGSRFRVREYVDE